LGERYRRIARRQGKKKAVVAVGRSMLVIVWCLLSDEYAYFNDLGPGYYDSVPIQKIRSATISANSKPSATRSPCSLPHDPHQPAHQSIRVRLRWSDGHAARGMTLSA